MIGDTTKVEIWSLEEAKVKAMELGMAMMHVKGINISSWNLVHNSCQYYGWIEHEDKHIGV